MTNLTMQDRTLITKVVPKTLRTFFTGVRVCETTAALLEAAREEGRAESAEMAAIVKRTERWLASIPADMLDTNPLNPQISGALALLREALGRTLTPAQHHVLEALALSKKGHGTFANPANQEAAIELRAWGYVADIYESPSGAVSASITMAGRLVYEASAREQAAMSEKGVQVSDAPQ